jgi:hypothetical protein
VILEAIFVLLAAQSVGLAPDWELKPKAEKLSKEIGDLRPLVERLEPSKWGANGAAEAYEKQRRDCLDGIGYTQNAAKRLAEKPSKLSLTLETLVRLESVLSRAESLSLAVRHYQNPAIAELLDSQMNTLSDSREWLRQQALELAQVREKELDVAEQEAQRCRTAISKQPAGMKNQP